MTLFSSKTHRMFREALLEDTGRGDLTCKYFVPAKAYAHAVIVAKEAGVFCGRPVAEAFVRPLRKKIKVRYLLKDGDRFKPRSSLIRMEGNARELLGLERVLLNFLGHCCGIATVTHRIVTAVKPYKVRIYDTRKTTPLWREVEKYAVRTGGGYSHRFSLGTGVLIKENHRPFGRIDNLSHYLSAWIIEVRNNQELKKALQRKARHILLDNFSPGRLRKAVRWIREADPRIIIEASGGITLKNVKKIASTGIDRISMGMLTHSVKSVDLSFLIKKAEV